MWYLAVIRGLFILLLGITAYIILLYAVGMRMPGRLRRHQKKFDNSNKRKTWIVLGYNVLLVFIIILSYLLIKYTVRGGI